MYDSEHLPSTLWPGGLVHRRVLTFNDFIDLTHCGWDSAGTVLFERFYRGTQKILGSGKDTVPL